VDASIGLSALTHGIRPTPVIATDIGARGQTQYAVYFTDVLTRVYAVDAQTGKLLWKTKAGRAFRVRRADNGPAVADGKVFAGFSSMETTTGSTATYEHAVPSEATCCPR
jgi:polyvinyl alcohol dehydrogenase (cytochrome)